jgi:hypothetical protein
MVLYQNQSRRSVGFIRPAAISRGRLRWLNSRVRHSSETFHVIVVHVEFGFECHSRRLIVAYVRTGLWSDRILKRVGRRRSGDTYCVARPLVSGPVKHGTGR